MDCKEQNLIETVHYHCTSAEPRKCMLGLTSRGSAAQNSFNAGDVGWRIPFMRDCVAARIDTDCRRTPGSGTRAACH